MDDIEEWQEDADSSETLEEQTDKVLELERLRSALHSLPDDMQDIIELRFVRELSSKKVADQLGITESNVRIIQYRALRKMRDYINDH